jgi:hypothetical protein
MAPTIRELAVVLEKGSTRDQQIGTKTDSSNDRGIAVSGVSERELDDLLDEFAADDL